MLSRLLLKTTGKQSVPKYLSRAPTRSRILSSGILNSLHKYNRALLDRSSVSTPFQGYRSFHSPSELATMSIDRRDYTPPAYLVPSVSSVKKRKMSTEDLYLIYFVSGGPQSVFEHACDSCSEYIQSKTESEPSFPRRNSSSLGTERKLLLDWPEIRQSQWSSLVRIPVQSKRCLHDALVECGCPL